MIATTPPRADTVAVATLRRSARGYKWIVPRCPYCGKAHGHGGGNHGDDPRRYLSHRAADCGRGGYDLVEDGALTATTDVIAGKLVPIFEAASGEGN